MTGITHKALVQEVASNKPNAATAFNLPDSATAPARSFDSALASGAVVPYHATNGTDWEDGIGTFTAGTPDTLARNSILDSSTGSAIDFSAGGDVTVRIVWPASIATESDLHMRSLTPGGRLTLASGKPDYQPLNAIAISGQDTTADTVTVTAHGWSVGTVVKSNATSGGLTQWSNYYVGNVTTDTVSLHTTLAAALAGTSKVDITGAVTATLKPQGIANTSIYYAPYSHNLISLWNGYRWQTIEFAETELAIGTVTSGKLFDVFAYINAGALALEKLEWTSDTVRATDITRQDGRLCKSGDKTRLWIGTFYSASTTYTQATLDKLYLINAYNVIEFLMNVKETTSSWTYSTATARQVNANTANQLDFILPTSNWIIKASLKMKAESSTSTKRTVRGTIGLDSVTSGVPFSGQLVADVSSGESIQLEADLIDDGIPMGKHYLAALETGGGTDTQTFYGGNITQQIRALINF